MESSMLRKRTPVTALADPAIVVPAIWASFAKLDPRVLIKNPVMFVVEVVAALTTVILLRDLFTGGANLGFTFQIVLWLWITVLFANFSEAVAEGRGKAQANSLRRTRTETQAKLLGAANSKDYRLVAGTSLKVGDIVLVEAGDYIPSDGEVIEGIASVNEAAITGESAPVIRESGGDRSAVTGGTQVLSDWIRVRITAAPGSTFMDRMIKLVEGAERQKTPNEIALNILLVGMTIIFVFATATIPSFAIYAGGPISVVVVVALFVTLIPTTIGALLVRHRHRRHGPPGALQRAGDVGASRGGSRRCRHPSARQDRHHHARQPAGDRAQAVAQRERAGAGRCRAARLAGRRDAGGPLHRRAGQGEVCHPRPGDGRAQRQVHPLLGPDAHERGRVRYYVDPQGGGRCHLELLNGGTPAASRVCCRGRFASRPRAPMQRASCRRSPRGSPSPAARRWRWPATASCSA